MTITLEVNWLKSCLIYTVWMNIDGSDDNGQYFYFHATLDGQPDLSRPMSKAEITQMYWDTADDEPASLVDLYTDFYKFRQIEFIIFGDRLSSAILIYRSVKKEVSRQETAMGSQKLGSSNLFNGWDLERDAAVDENLATIQASYAISIGSATVIAVAALEGLLIDLIPEGVEAPEGLHQLMEYFLKHHGVPNSKKRIMHKKLRKVSDRRNQFAHALTGSYFSDNNSIENMFTEDALEDTFQTVSKLALDMESLELKRSSQA